MHNHSNPDCFLGEIFTNSRHIYEHPLNKFTIEELKKFSDGWTDEKNESFLNYIRSNWLMAPSHGPLNISLEHKNVVDYSQEGQSEYVDEVSLSSIGG